MALTLQEAIEQCRQSVGRPIVQSCMGGGHRGVVVGADLESCKARHPRAVKACVEKTMNAAHGRANVPVAVPVAKQIEAPKLTVRASSFLRHARSVILRPSSRPKNRIPNRFKKCRLQPNAQPSFRWLKGDLAWFLLSPWQRACSARSDQRCDQRRQQGNGSRPRDTAPARIRGDSSSLRVFNTALPAIPSKPWQSFRTKSALQIRKVQKDTCSGRIDRLLVFSSDGRRLTGPTHTCAVTWH